MKGPNTYNILMILKYIPTLKEQQKLPSCTYLATYRLAKDICKFSPDFDYRYLQI